MPKYMKRGTDLSNMAITLKILLRKKGGAVFLSSAKGSEKNTH